MRGTPFLHDFARKQSELKPHPLNQVKLHPAKVSNHPQITLYPLSLSQPVRSPTKQQGQHNSQWEQVILNRLVAINRKYWPNDRASGHLLKDLSAANGLGQRRGSKKKDQWSQKVGNTDQKEVTRSINQAIRTFLLIQDHQDQEIRPRGV